MSMDNIVAEVDSSKSDEDTFSIIDRLAENIRLEDDNPLSSEDQARLVLKLYEGPRKCQCCVNWTDELPPDSEFVVEKKDDDGEDASTPLTIRHNVMPGEGKTQIDMHSIEIRNADVRNVLVDVFRGFDNLVKGVKYLVFYAPFRQFFWRWQTFEDAIEAQEAGETKSILIQLRTIVKAELAAAFAVSQELTKNGLINYKYLWTIFPPGELLYSDDDGSDRFFNLQSSVMRFVGQRAHYEFACRYLDWDGVEFGFLPKRFEHWPFKSTLPITQLRVYPAKYMHNREAIAAKCIERGRRFEKLAGISYKGYMTHEGAAEGQRSNSKPGPVRRIILDAKSHPSREYCDLISDLDQLEFHTGLIRQMPVEQAPPGGHRPLIPMPPPPGMPPGTLQPMDVPPPPGRRLRPPMPGYHHAPPPAGDFIDSDFISPPLRPGQYRPGPPPIHHGTIPMPIGVLSRKKKSSKPQTIRRHKSIDSFSGSSSTGSSDSELDDEPVKLGDDQLQLCTARMLGFCLKAKGWRSFDIDRICDIDWNTQPFESLVLPEGYKDLILSFVESQLKDGDTFDDVINGKGGGLVILLSGEPGVGKTLTAESVAEKIQAPLYKMELGQLKDDGYDSDSSSSSRNDGGGGGGGIRRVKYNKTGSKDEETEICSAFDLASKWKAVLLIDECDLYLEKRSDTTSLKRNRIVTRFLQELEYYPSLLFLTTNREKMLDPAIYSRIHLTINYPALDAPSRRTIWKTFLGREKGVSVSDEEYEILALINVNGRRIRNITKTARIMAKRAGRGITFGDIRNVMRITEGLEI